MMRAKLLLTALAFSAMAVSCTLNKLEEPVQGGKQLVVLTATAAQSGTGTKTTLVDNGPDIYWSPGDKIMAFQPSWGAGSYSTFSSNLERPALTAEFSGWASFSAGQNTENNEIWGLYPKPDDFYPYFSGTSVKTKHPMLQTAQAGTFDPKALITVARSKSPQLSFYNVCGGLKFSVASGNSGDDLERIKYVELRSNDGTSLSGTATIRIDKDGHPYVSELEEASSTVILAAPDGEYFVPGAWYYLTCLPAVLEQGYTLTFRRDNDMVASYVVTSPCEIKRSVWGRLDTPDQGLEWAYSIEPMYNEIWYWTTDESTIEIPAWASSSLYWGANLVSNVANGLNGCILTFDGPVTKIPNVGADLTRLTDIALPSTVTKLDGWAFTEAENLESVSLPDGLVEIGQWAFQNCWSLEELEIPASVQKIGQGAFGGCYRLDTFKGPLASADGRCIVKEGELLAFASGSDTWTPDWSSWTPITSYSIPEGVTALGDHCFASVGDYLEEVTLPASLSHIGSEVFLGCGNLRSFSGPFASAFGHLLIEDGVIKAAAMNGVTALSIPGTVHTIASRAFYNTSWSLQTLIIKEGVEVIEEEAFSFCGLKEVTLPSSLRELGRHAFMGCDQLESFSGRFATQDHHYLVDDNGVLVAVAKATASCEDNLPNTVTAIDSYAFQGTHNMAFIDIPSSVVEIREGAFYASEILVLELPEGLERIGASAFGYSELDELVIPSTVTEIGYGIVQGCEDLDELTILAETPPDTGWSNPLMNSNLTAIYVPAGSVNAYKTAVGWSNYADIYVALP